MTGVPKSAMVLAAGLGTRMRPISDTVPKPLVEIGGRALIDHAIDRRAPAGVEEIVVNVHYKAEMVAARLAARTYPRIRISREEELLETGGGVANALPLLGEFFFVVNADIMWLDGVEDTLARLAAAFDPAGMDAVLLLQRTVTAVGYDGRGDFEMDAWGVLKRRAEMNLAPFVWSGLQMLHHRLFDAAPKGRFSINRLWDEAIEKGRLFGVRLDGVWIHVGTPQGLEDAETFLRDLAREP